MEERPAILDAAPNVQEALSEAVSAVYFADPSDYLEYLWRVIRHLSPEAAEMLENDQQKAYDTFTTSGRGKA